MTTKDTLALKLTSSPHVRTSETTSRIMWTVSLCLLPSGLVSIKIFWIACVMGNACRNNQCGFNRMGL